jgi:hypothetical protein
MCEESEEVGTVVANAKLKKGFWRGMELGQKGEETGMFV